MNRLLGTIKRALPCVLLLVTASFIVYRIKSPLHEDYSSSEILVRERPLHQQVKQNPTRATRAQRNDLRTASLPFQNQTPEVYQLFQSVEEVDFPTVDAHAPRIPHIIHQMYASEMIPDIYTGHVKSFIKNNPTWQYRFWTDWSGRKLLEKHHPYLLDVYDRFGNNVKRSDLLRYAVLYEYGGFYADLDVDNLRSLNRTTTKYACVVSVEPFEHSVLLNNMALLMNNAIMSCRPKHPFFKQLLKNLQHASSQGYPVGTTGPGYITRQFYKYNNIQFSHPGTKTDLSSNSPYFYKGKRKEDDINAVYVPNSQYFMDKLDPVHTRKDGKFTRLCSSIESLPSLQKKRACTEFHRRREIRENKKYTFTVHHWYHLWDMNKTSVGEMKTVKISDIVPTCVLYSGENISLSAHAQP